MGGEKMVCALTFTTEVGVGAYSRNDQPRKKMTKT